MSKPFFQEIFKHMDGVDLKIALKRKGDKLSFSFLPIARVDDKAKDMIQAITGTGTPEELDQLLIEQLAPALDIISEWSLDIEKFEDQMAEVKAADQKREQEKKEKEQIKNKAKRHYDSAKDDFDNGMYKSALESVNKALAILMDYPEAHKLKDQVKVQLGTGTLFENAN